MALAYERPVMLCSQEPRRYPYFSIGDMQMSFWDTEPELSSAVATWIRSTPGVFARRVRNHELDHPRIAAPEFRFDPALRFVGPNNRRRRWRGSRS